LILPCCGACGGACGGADVQGRSSVLTCLSGAYMGFIRDLSVLCGRCPGVVAGGGVLHR